MSESHDKVLHLLARGTIGTEEAETLLAAMRPAERPWWHALGDPLELGTITAAALSTVSAAAAVALTAASVRFDGPLDTHLTDGVSNWTRAAVELGCNWFGLAFMFFLAARVFARRGRLLDFIWVVGVARGPLVFGGLTAAAYVAIAGAPTGRSVTAIGLVAPLLVTLSWAVVMMVRGFGTASGLRGPKLLIVALGTLLGAELATKALLISVGW